MTTTLTACADCGGTTDLRHVRFLTAPDGWLCVEAAQCRRRRAERLPCGVGQRFGPPDPKR